MGHSSVRAKVRRRKVAALAAYSRQFTVHNNTIPKGDLNSKNVVTKWKEIRTTKFDTPIYGKMFEIDKDGHYHLIERKFDPTPLLLNHKQPKRLIKCKKRKYTGEKWTVNGAGGWMRVYDTKPGRDKRNDFVTFFPNYPYTLPKMNKVEYMEKLVQHKLAKWERKNPQPAKKDDMFKEEFVTPWQIERNKAEERIRDFVVSVYDKLPVMGNIVDRANKKMKAIKIGEVKDVDGKGHNVNHPNLSPNDKLYKHAEAVAINAMKMDKRILDADLLNHKHDQKRPLNVHRQPINIKKAA